MIGYLDENVRTLSLMMPKMSGYIKTFKGKEVNNKLMSFPYRWWEAIRTV